MQARFNYADPPDVKPAYYLYGQHEQARAIAEQRNPGKTAHEMEVVDLRVQASGLHLDESGLTFVQHHTDVDFYDDADVKARYYPQVTELVRAHTGAAEVVAFDHNVRNAERAEAKVGKAQLPVKSVHNDYTERSGPQRLLDLLPDRFDELSRRRYAIINVWRPIVGPVLRSPFAVCDARSMADGDLVATDLVYADRTGEIYTVRHNPSHRWMYLSQMQREDVLLLKCYDSDRNVPARFTAHSAFELEGSESAPARESIEIRTFALF